MDLHTIVTGAVGFLAGMATAIMAAAAISQAGRRAEEQIESPEEWARRYAAELETIRDERREQRAENRRKEEEKEGRGRE